MDKVIKYFEEKKIKVIDITNSINNNVHSFIKKYKHNNEYSTDDKSLLVYFMRSDINDILFRSLITSTYYSEHYRNNCCFIYFDGYITLEIDDKTSSQQIIDLINDGYNE